MVEMSQRRFAEAENHFKKAIEMDPKSPGATIDLANFYRLQGKLTEAEETLQSGIHRTPDAPQLYVDWANLLSAAGKAGEAEGVLQKLREQMPRSPTRQSSLEITISIGMIPRKH